MATIVIHDERYCRDRIACSECGCEVWARADDSPRIPLEVAGSMTVGWVNSYHPTLDEPDIHFDSACKCHCHEAYNLTQKFRV
jgi:hypothetical protein